MNRRFILISSLIAAGIIAISNGLKAAALQHIDYDFRGFDLAKMTITKPLIYANIEIQNPSKFSVKIENILGTVEAANGEILGKISYFQPIILKYGSTLIQLPIELNYSGAASTVSEIIISRKLPELLAVGTMGIGNAQIPFTIKMI